MLTLLALICFAVATIWWAIQKAWPYAFLAAGLALLTLAAHPTYMAF